MPLLLSPLSLLSSLPPLSRIVGVTGGVGIDGVVVGVVVGVTVDVDVCC